jgi:molecular chaperone DnaK (HSP70)
MNPKKNDLYTSITPGDGCDAPSPLAMLKNGSSELIIVFDLGGGTLDVTLLNIKKNNEGNTDFEVLATDGDIHLGGSDFDNKLIDFCINEFCKSTGYKEEEIRLDKFACKRLKTKCENSKKLLSIMNETVINIDNFYGTEDLIIPLNRNKFEELCKDLYEEIEKIIYSTIKNNGKTISQIDEVILVGGATKMTGIKDFMGRLFGPAKIKSTINPDEAVAYGATLDRAKMEENVKINFNLQDIIAYNLGVEKENNEMSVIIKKYSKIPCSYDKNYITKVDEKHPNIIVPIYEGNSKSVKDKDCLKLGEIVLDNINKIGDFKYNVNFKVDVNSKLTVIIKVESLGIEKEVEIKNITHGLLDKTSKKIKILKTKELTPLVSINSILASSRNKLNESTTDNEKIKNLVNCIQIQEDKVNNYVLFLVDNETAYEYVYNSTKELFDFYVDMFKYKKKEKEELSSYIKKIKEFMKNLIKAIGYMEELLGTLNKLRNLGCENEFYEIFTNFIELLNNEALDKKKNKNYSRYYCKLYFERVFYDTRKYISEYDINNMDEKIKQKYIEQKKIAEDELKKANSFTNFIEQKLKTGEFPYGKTGYTILGQKIDKFEQNMDNLSLEEFQEVLDIYENMAASFDKTKYSLGELYCLGNIIYINNQVFKRGYQKLWREINRFETILQYKDYNEQEWIGDIKELIDEIKLKKV